MLIGINTKGRKGADPEVGAGESGNTNSTVEVEIWQWGLGSSKWWGKSWLQTKHLYLVGYWNLRGLMACALIWSSGRHSFLIILSFKVEMRGQLVLSSRYLDVSYVSVLGYFPVIIEEIGWAKLLFVFGIKDPKVFVIQA